MIFTKTINKPQHNNIHKERYKCKVCYAKFIQCAKINILANRERERERESALCGQFVLSFQFNACRKAFHFSSKRCNLSFNKAISFSI